MSIQFLLENLVLNPKPKGPIPKRLVEVSHCEPGVGRGDEKLGVVVAHHLRELVGHVQGVQGSGQLLLSTEI